MWEVYLVLVVLMEPFNQYVNLRQLLRYRNDIAPPAALKGLVDQPTFLKSCMYNADKMMFSISQAVFEWVLLLLQLVSGFFPSFWRTAGAIAGPNRYYQMIAFMFLTSLFDIVKETPFEWYSDFVVEEKHGFNKKTARLFIVDLIKSRIINFFFLVAFTVALVLVIEYGGDAFLVWMWILMVSFVLFMHFLHPNFIAPLFNKFTSLPDGDLRTGIEKLVSAQDFPLGEIYQVDGSARSKHSNAYFYGFWKQKRIVLYDTLLEMEQPRVEAVVAHELGHWFNSHHLKLFIVVFGNLAGVCMFFSFVRTSGARLIDLLGFHGLSDNAFIALFVTSILLGPTVFMMGVAVTSISRRFEYQADAYARKLGHGEKLAEGLLEMFTENLGTLNPDPLFSMLHHTHPTLTERLKELPPPKVLPKPKQTKNEPEEPKEAKKDQ